MWVDLLGLTPEKIAGEETWDPKKGKRTRDFGDKVGDKVMSILTGTDYATEVQKHTKTNHVDHLTNYFGDRITKTKGLEGYDDIGDLSKLSEKKLEQELKNREATRNARSTFVAKTGGTADDLDLTVTDPGTIVAGATKYVKDENTTKENKAEDFKMLLLDQQGRRSDNQFAVQMAQVDYQNRAAEMKDARLERRDRQSAIQQMMAGLATMGASIAI